MWKWLGVLVTLLLITTGCQTANETDAQAKIDLPEYAEQLRGAVVNPPRPLANFIAPSTAGEFQLSDYEGQVILLYFGYMTCPDVCPATSAELKWVYEDLGEPDNVQIVFVTVDPERDELARIDAYVHLFHKDFVGIRAEGETLARIMEQFGARAEKQEISESALGYLMDHTAAVYLISPNGSLIEQFLFGTPYADIAHDVQVVLDHFNEE